MIDLPFPDKILWPNGRGHHMAKHKAFQKHKEWAYHATLEVLPLCLEYKGNLVRLRYTITPKTAHAIDKDNAVAAMKAYQDGIALALKTDDSSFDTPEIVFAKPKKPGRVEVEILGRESDVSFDPGPAMVNGGKPTAGHGITGNLKHGQGLVVSQFEI